MSKKLVILLFLFIILTSGYFFVKFVVQKNNFVLQKNNNIATDDFPYFPDPYRVHFNLEGQKVSLNTSIYFGKEFPQGHPSLLESWLKTGENALIFDTKQKDFDMDGDEDALFIFAHSPELNTEKLFFYVGISLRVSDIKLKEYEPTNSVFLGDRIIPKSFSIENETLKIDYLTRAPNEDFSVGPTILKRAYLKLEKGELKMILDEVVSISDTKYSVQPKLIENGNEISRIDWGLSFVKNVDWKVVKNSIDKLTLEKVSGENIGAILTITLLSGGVGVDNDEKFGQVVYSYGSKKWMRMVNPLTKNQESISYNQLAVPLYYTKADNLPVFSGANEPTTRIIPLNQKTFIKISITGFEDIDTQKDLISSFVKI